MRATAAAITAALLLVGACSSGDDSADRPGEPSVYNRIAALDDCAALQEEFDRAAANNDRAEPGTAEHKATLGYMKAAEARRDELNC